MKKTILASVVLAASLFCGSVAMAAGDSSPGDTLGPASGSVTKPSAAVQKQASNPGGAAAGGVGVAGKPGGESGVDPKASGDSSQPAKH